MALVNDAIETCQQCVNRIGDYSRQSIESSCSSFEYVLGQQDFATYISGTEHGAKMAEEIKKMITILRDQLLPQILDLISKTNEFLEKQRGLNKTGK